MQMMLVITGAIRIAIFILTHRREPCQAEPHSLSFINIRIKLSYNDKWLENNFPNLIHSTSTVLYGWVAGACQAMADGKTKTETLQSRMT